jgi:hypothetical protein
VAAPSNLRDPLQLRAASAAFCSCVCLYGEGRVARERKTRKTRKKRKRRKKEDEEEDEGRKRS